MLSVACLLMAAQMGVQSVEAAEVNADARLMHVNRASEAERKSCPCSGALRCTGPKGGRYCVTPRGKKQYRKQPPKRVALHDLRSA